MTRFSDSGDLYVKNLKEFLLGWHGHLAAIFHCRVARFNSVDHLSIFFARNYGAEQTKVYYIGLKGDFTEVTRHDLYQQ